MGVGVDEQVSEVGGALDVDHARVAEHDAPCFGDDQASGGDEVLVVGDVDVGALVGGVDDAGDIDHSGEVIGAGVTHLDQHTSRLRAYVQPDTQPDLYVHQARIRRE
jgi:hypothetical protein